MKKAPQVSQTDDEPFPLRIGSGEDFAQVQALLKDSSFNETTVCRLLNIQTMADLSVVKPAEVDWEAADSPALILLIRLFLFSELLPCDEAEAVIGSTALASLLALDLIRSGSFADGAGGIEQYYASVFLYPVDGLLIASDSHHNPDGTEFVPPPDIVFPAINGGTLIFLKVFPRSPVESALDLCSGSGVAALALSKSAGVVVAADITRRATHFALFNRGLNNCDNLEAACGDLYEAVEGRTFDRIVAHPPYVASLTQTTIYRDGGETGELLIRRIVTGLPQYLRPGGTYYSLCVGLDTKEGSFEERARHWLGEHRDEFDIIFAFADARTPEQFAKETGRLTGKTDAADIARWEEVFNAVGAESLSYGALVIHRRAVSDAGHMVQPLTMRPRLTMGTDGSCFDWMFRWRHWIETPGALQKLATEKPRLNGGLQMRARYVVKEGNLVPAEYMLESEKLFAAATQIDGWLVGVVAEFNGERTVAALYDAAREAAALPEHFSLEEFLRVTAYLIERGYLDIDESLLRTSSTEP